MKEQTRKIRLRVTPQVARLIAEDASAENQRRAIAGDLPLTGEEHLTVLFLLAHRGDKDIRKLACAGLRHMPVEDLLPLLNQEELHPQLLQFIAGYRADDRQIVEGLLAHPRFGGQALALVARRADREVLGLLADRFGRSPEVADLRQFIAANPAADDALLTLFGPTGDESISGGEDESAEDPEAEEFTEEDGEWEEPEEEGLSKYQMTMHMGVAEKIKAALNGDKEWRKILLQDTNKLVSCAVMKNPRITDGEVLSVAKNKSSSEELIRLITMNREWMKNYTIKSALVAHPRVQPGQAIRYMNILTDRDLKILAKSRDVSKVIVNNARRLLNAREKRR